MPLPQRVAFTCSGCYPLALRLYIPTAGPASTRSSGPPWLSMSPVSCLLSQRNSNIQSTLQSASIEASDDSDGFSPWESASGMVCLHHIFGTSLSRVQKYSASTQAEQRTKACHCQDLDNTDPETLSSWILAQQRARAPEASGNLTMLLTAVAVSCKFVASAVRKVRRLVHHRQDYFSFREHHQR